jgi:PBP1b-binding outer membrane lipoprotein LpoB
MKKMIKRINILLITVVLLILAGCRTSSDERSGQGVNDSIKLDDERRELIERANRMLESAEQENDSESSEDSSNQ